MQPVLGGVYAVDSRAMLRDVNQASPNKISNKIAVLTPGYPKTKPGHIQRYKTDSTKEVPSVSPATIGKAGMIFSNIINIDAHVNTYV